MTRPEDRTTEQRLNRAAPFRRNEEEALIRMRDERPDAFDRITPPSGSASACTRTTRPRTRR